MDGSLQENVARALRTSGHHDAAGLLAACELRLTDDGIVSRAASESGEASPHVVEIELMGPRGAAVLCDGEHPMTRALRAAVRAVLPPNTWIQRWTFTVAEEAETAEGTMETTTRGTEIDIAVSNQAVDAGEARVWQHLRFRSESELRVAQALDRTGVLFLPNCMARLGPAEHRENREPDFLICADGKWGILEVDGEPFHPPARTVHDHERARLFKAHGVRVVEHFDAGACYRDPDRVVRMFLELLRRA